MYKDIIFGNCVQIVCLKRGKFNFIQPIQRGELVSASPSSDACEPCDLRVARVPHPPSTKNESSSLGTSARQNRTRDGQQQHSAATASRAREQGRSTKAGAIEQQSRPPRRDDTGTGRGGEGRECGGGRRTQLPQTGGEEGNQGMTTTR